MPYILEQMRAEDIAEVASIERLCFTMPWPTSAYRRELKTPETNRYIVARFVPPDIAVQLGMPGPTIDNITTFDHPNLYPPDDHLVQSPEQPDQNNRSLLNTIL